MTGLTVLAVIALFQLAFIVLLVVFLGVRREVDRQRADAFEAKRAEVSEPLSAWLTGNGGMNRFVAAVGKLPGGSALAFTGSLVRTTIPVAEREALALALRKEPWIRRALAGAGSRRWGRRLEAARALTLVGTPRDRELVMALLNDKRPAVAVAAVSALPRVADAALVDYILVRLIQLPTVVRLYLQDSLRDMGAIVEPELAKRLETTASPRALSSWIEIAAALMLPTSLDRVAKLADHADPFVRKSVARALRRVPKQSTVDVLSRLLADDDAAVRGVAAHSLGELASPVAIPALVNAAHDPSWIVRYRATLALAQLGEPGRAAIRKLRSDPDRYVVDMATLIAGLGDGALLDLSEV